MKHFNFLSNFRWFATIILLITLSIGQMWAAKYTWTYASLDQWLFSSGNTSPGYSSGTATLNSVSWSYDRGTAKYLGGLNSSIQFGAKNNVENPSFTCSAFSSGYTITEVSVKASSYNGAHKATIKVGGSTVKSATATDSPTSTPTAITSGAISTSGNVDIIFSNGSRALYVQSFSITYCKLPTSLTNGTITSSTAHLSWSDTDSPGKYQVYCSTSSSTPAANATPTATVTTKSVDLESLTSSQTYYWWVRAYDETNSSKSAWVAGTSFTTSASASCSANPTIGNASLNGSFSLSSIPLQCSVTSDGGTGCTITDAGFVYVSGGDDPTISDNKTSGTYSTNITGSITGTFSKGTTYKIKAYATNGHGTALSSSSFTLIPRSVTFHKNDGSETTTVQYVNDGTATALTSNAWSQTGYTFNGWNTNADGKSGSNYADGANITATANVDLYAKWAEKPKYTITLDAGNGTISDANWTNTSGSTYTRTQSNGDESITLPTPSCNCAGWVFKGWSTSSKSNADSFTPDKADGASFTPASNVTYYAVYRQSTPSGTTYNKITSSGDMTSGDYAIVAAFSESGNYYSMKNIINASGYMNEIAFSHATSWTNSDADYIWKVLVFGEKVAFYSADVSKFLTINDDGEWELSTDGQLFSKEFNSTTKAWTFTSSTGYQLTYSNQFYVGNSQNKAIYLYKRGNAESGNYYTSPTCSSLSVTGAASPVAGGIVQVSATAANNGDKVWAVYTIDKNYNFDSWSVSGTGASLSSTSARFTEITVGSADVTVTAGFERKDWHVQWKVNGVELTGSDLGDAQNYYDNDEWATVLPPNPSSCDDGDGASDVFVGWTTNTWGGKSTEPAVLFKNGRDAPVINADVTYHAVFAKESSTTYKRITSTKYIGLDSKIVIVNNSSEKALKNDYSAVDVSSNLSADDATLSSVSSDWVWTAKSQDSDGYYILKNGSKQLGINKTGGMTSSYSACGDYNTVASAWDLWEASDDSEFNTTTSNCFYLWNWATTTYYNFLTLYNSTTWESKYYANSSSKGSPTASENAMRLYIPEYTNYLISCCTAYDITLTGSGTVTGGTIEADPTSACEGAAVTLAATPSTGYTFTEWIVKDGSANVVTSDVIADGDEDESYVEMTMPAYDVTVDATFTAKEYTIVLDENGGTSDGEATATYNSSSLSSVTHASYTGYTLLGYYTETSGGDMVITANGALVAGVEDYTDEDGKWIYDDAAIFAAHWKPTGTWGVTITAPSNGTITVTYNSGANSMTSGSAYIGGSVTITATGNTGYELATNGLKVNGTTFTSGNSLTLSEDITIAATFSLKKHNVSVTELSTVTISAGDIDEGENDDVNYGTELTLSYSAVTSGHYWSGWKVTNTGGDDVTASVVDGSTLTVPDYDIIVTAKIYGDVKAWCVPTFNVTGDVHLTSTAGVYVNLTSATDNLINFSGSDLYNVSKITIDYLDENGDVVANASSPLRLYGSAGSSLAEGNINSSSFTSGAYDQDYSIRLTVPADVYDTEYNYKLRLKLHKLINGVSTYRVIKTVEHPMNGRALPEEFVIAVKQNDQWYALPNTIVDNNRAITPLKITVNNATTPTAATYAPSTAVYKGDGRYASGTNIYGIRFTDGVLKDAKYNHLEVSSSSGTNYVWLSYTGSSTCNDWWLSSSDFHSYTLKVPSSGAGDKSFGINNRGNIGFHASDATNLCKEVYLLPIGTKYTPVEATATDWTGDAVGVTATTDANKLGIKEQDGTVTSPVALSSASTSHVADFNGGIDFTGMTGETILLQWYDGESLIGGSEVTVPSIIAAGVTSTWSTLPSAPTLDDIVVLSKPMTVDATHAKAKQIVIDQSSSNTGKLTINPNKGLEVAGTVKVYNGSAFGATTASDLVLESSSAGNASLIFDNSNGDAATVQMYSKASVVGNTWNWQYVGTPFTGSIPLYNYYGSWMYKWNSGWEVVHGTDELTPFAGYCLTQESGTTHVMDGTLVATDGNDIEIDMAASTNMVIANSWTAPIYVGGFTASTFTFTPATIYLFNTGSAENGSSEYVSGDEAGTYVTIPVKAAEYTGNEFIAPMQGFFIKNTSGSDGTITLKYDELVRPADSRGIVGGPMHAPSRERVDYGKPDVMKIWANGSEYNDRVVILAREDFSEGFDNGWDGEKLSFGNASPSVYVINEEGGYDAVSAIPEYEGTLVGFRAGSEDNVYTMTFEYNGDEVLYLNDLKAQMSAEIANGQTYTFTTEEGDSEVRFIISHNPIRRITTGVDEVVGGTKVRKIIINDKLFIIRGGRMFSADGQLVK